MDEWSCDDGSAVLPEDANKRTNDVSDKDFSFS